VLWGTCHFCKTANTLSRPTPLEGPAEGWALRGAFWHLQNRPLYPPAKGAPQTRKPEGGSPLGRKRPVLAKQGSPNTKQARTRPTLTRRPPNLQHVCTTWGHS
jgi:hypothetical protein